MREVPLPDGAKRWAWGGELSAQQVNRVAH
jgi:hypothetical protein